ncbi:MAG: VOC family protein [Armatimonadetes bacterium]|nr:VOC family protein [Armatimonadota bacterium]
MSIKIGHIEVFCKDTAEARDWYVDVLGARPVSEQDEYQWVEIGGTEILLRPGKGVPGGGYKDSAVALVLYVEDAAVFKEQLENNGVEVTHGDNDECLTFQDPDGHWIQAVQR